MVSKGQTDYDKIDFAIYVSTTQLSDTYEHFLLLATCTCNRKQRTFSGSHSGPRLSSLNQHLLSGVSFSISAVLIVFVPRVILPPSSGVAA
jgi:hypothetical protein